MAIELPAEDRKRALASIKRFLVETLEVEASDLQAIALLDYVLQEIGPSVYNRGIADAQAYLRERVADLEGACSEPEFPFWPKPGPVRRR